MASFNVREAHVASDAYRRKVFSTACSLGEHSVAKTRFWEKVFQVILYKKMKPFYNKPKFKK